LHSRYLQLVHPSHILSPSILLGKIDERRALLFPFMVAVNLILIFFFDFYHLIIETGVMLQSSSRCDVVGESRMLHLTVDYLAIHLHI
jgi:hypothetical protein